MNNLIKREDNALTTDIKIIVEPIDLDFLDESTIIDTDIYDISFSKGINKAEIYDYSFAIFCGITSYVLNYALKSKYDIQNSLENKNIFEVINIFKILYENEKDNKQKLENTDVIIDEILQKIRNYPAYISLIEDFTHSLSFEGLFVAVLEELTNQDNHKYSIEYRIQKGIINWLFEQVDEYNKNKKFKEEKKDIGIFKNAIIEIQKLIVVIANNEKKVPYLKEFVLSHLVDEKQYNKVSDGLKASFIENITIKVNYSLLRSYISLRNIIDQISLHHITSIEGLNIIDFSKYKEDNHRKLIRLETVSSGIFTAIDITIAAVDKHKHKDKKAFSKISITNICYFLICLNEDKNYIVEDIKEIQNKTKVVELKEYKSISDDELRKYFNLNSIEEKILYSLKLDLINCDIQKTKDSKNQIEKNKWKEKWMEFIKSSSTLAKPFESNQEKLYQAINTYIANGNTFWLYSVALELVLFTPYYQLEDTKIKKLKVEYKDYVEDIFCKGQTVITYKDIKELNKSFNKYYAKLDNSALKVGATVAGTALVTVATGGIAFALAPQVAVALFGGANAALHGAALVNACLAAAGGGALATGGLGMAGGTVIIAGGGALVGLGTSSAAAKIGFALLSSSNLIHQDSSKLLVKCDYIMLHKFQLEDEVNAIYKKISDEIEIYKLRLKYFEIQKINDEETKKTINELKKSITYLERTNQALEKILK